MTKLDTTPAVMNDSDDKKNYPALFGKALGVTALAFLLSSLFMSPFSASISAFFSTPEKNNFTVSDFYNMVADSRAVSHLDDNVVIINIDDSDRQDIADILQIVSLSGASAVGLDVMFDEPREGDETLIESIRVCEGVVMPLSMRPDTVADIFRISDHSYFYTVERYDTLGLDARYAVASMPSKYEGDMVREMQEYFITATGDTILSFPVALARIVDPVAYRRLMDRGEMLEYISYHSRRFAILEPETLIENADTLAGRIVLIGAMNEPGDLHPTPVDSSMPGVLIHANAIATILDNAYMEVLPRWSNVMIGFILCFIVVFTHVTVSNGARGLVLRLLQVALLWSVMQIGYWFFVSRSLIIDFSYALLMLAFGLFACDIWNGIVTIVKGIHKWHNERKMNQIKTPDKI